MNETDPEDMTQLTYHHRLHLWNRTKIRISFSEVEKWQPILQSTPERYIRK